MLDLKIAQFSKKKSPKRWRSSFYSKIAQKVNKYLGYFSKKIWIEELSKITQSGDTALPTYLGMPLFEPTIHISNESQKYNMLLVHYS